MIAHVVLFRLRPELSPEEVAAFVAQAREVLGPIPGVKNLRVGAGLGVKAEVDHPVALLMEFEDEDALQGYQVHPEHQRFVHEIAGPVEDDKRVYDYRY